MVQLDRPDLVIEAADRLVEIARQQPGAGREKRFSKGDLASLRPTLPWPVRPD
jgi:hypothetical protein